MANRTAFDVKYARPFLLRRGWRWVEEYDWWEHRLADSSDMVRVTSGFVEAMIAEYGFTMFALVMDQAPVTGAFSITSPPRQVAPWKAFFH